MLRDATGYKNRTITMSNYRLKPNPLITLLDELGIIKEKDFSFFHKGTRDVKDINVLIDNASGALILDKCVTNLQEYYTQNTIYAENSQQTLIDRALIATTPLEDDVRRFKLFAHMLKGKKILDFGCGKGGFLRIIKNNKISENLFGLELNTVNRSNLNKLGIECSEGLSDNYYDFDFIFLNHVFEHLENPISILKELLNRLKKDGNLIIEIPHGNDFLIKDANIESFKNFTFWSEHLCLYTKDVVERVIKLLQIENYSISFYQRYGINNHFYWFKENKPGGHEKCKLFNLQIDTSYRQFLVETEKTDTMYIFIGPMKEELSKALRSS